MPDDTPLTPLEEFYSEPQSPMVRDFAREMAVNPPEVGPVGEGNDPAPILPLDADEGPPDLEQVIQGHLNGVTRAALEQLDGSDRELYPVRSRVRSAVEPIMARHKARLADIHNRALPAGPTVADGEVLDRLRGAEGLAANHPNRRALEAHERLMRARGSLTDSGAKFEIAQADAERDAALNELAKRWNVELTSVAQNAEALLDTGTIEVTEEHRRSGLLLVEEMTATSPRHGLPHFKWALRQAAVDQDARASLLAALPAVRSMYEDSANPYGGSAQLRALIGKANDLFQTADQRVAKVRLERIERTKWEIDEFIKNAISGGTEALDGDGRPVLLPPEKPPRPRREPPKPPHPFRRLDSAATREADEQRRRELAEAEE